MNKCSCFFPVGFTQNRRRSIFHCSSSFIPPHSSISVVLSAPSLIFLFLLLLPKNPRCLAPRHLNHLFTKPNKNNKLLYLSGYCSNQTDYFYLSCFFLQPVGIYPKKYDWAGTTAFGMAGIPSQHIGGDCSLYVRAATIDFDDGEWECQVTASDFAAQDALTSAPVQLVVRGKF